MSQLEVKGAASCRRGELTHRSVMCVFDRHLALSDRFRSTSNSACARIDRGAHLHGESSFSCVHPAELNDVLHQCLFELQRGVRALDSPSEVLLKIDILNPAKLFNPLRSCLPHTLINIISSSPSDSHRMRQDSLTFRPTPYPRAEHQGCDRWPGHV